MEWYSAIKNEVPIHTVTWMNPENIMLREISWTQNIQCRMNLIM